MKIVWTLCVDVGNKHLKNKVRAILKSVLLESPHKKIIDFISGSAEDKIKHLFDKNTETHVFGPVNQGLSIFQLPTSPFQATFKGLHMDLSTKSCQTKTMELPCWAIETPISFVTLILNRMMHAPLIHPLLEMWQRFMQFVLLVLPWLRFHLLPWSRELTVNLAKCEFVKVDLRYLGSIVGWG